MVSAFKELYLIFLINLGGRALTQNCMEEKKKEC
jgi:hypothetical protein